MFGRLKPGVPRERDRRTSTRSAVASPRDNRGVYRRGSGFTATTLPVRDELTRNARPLLLILLGTTGFVLLIACANVANLSLARLLRRERELAVRAALGAGRGRLIRQLLTESTLLSLAGGAVGLAVRLLDAVDADRRSSAGSPSRTGEIEIDPRVLAVHAGVSFVTGIVFGILPALSSRVDLVSAMKQGEQAVGRQHRPPPRAERADRRCRSPSRSCCWSAPGCC